MAKSLENKTRYEFGPFRVDLADRLVFRENQVVSLTPKAFDMLVVLLQNRSRVVSKEELLGAVWPDSFVEEGILAVNVSTLRRALGEAADGRPYIETMPRRGYRFMGDVKESNANGHRGPRLRLILTIALPVVAAISSLWFLLASHPKPQTPLKPIPLTSYRGSEYSPTFSPGGDQVAFSWNSENEDNFDIYVKPVGASGNPLRLTSDPAPDRFPAWSPDGRYIAFERTGAIYLIPPLGGPERKLTDFNASRLAWTPDAKSIAAGGWRQGIYLISVETGEKRQITFPPADQMGDVAFAFSPDGKDLVFARQVTSTADLLLMPTPAVGERREPRKLLALRAGVNGLVWTPDGRDVIYAPSRLGGLWRVAVGEISDALPQPIAVEEGAAEPALSRPAGGSVTRLVYSRTELDLNIWLRKGPDATPVRLIASTRTDTNPQFSPDGKTIVFTSNRSGVLELWSCGADGANPFQLTSMKADLVNAPRWSPDGKSIAFSAMVERNRDIYIISADGSGLRRLTAEHSEEGRPSWSRDGRWIYFYSNRSGRQQIFKAPSEGGPATQVTAGGGHESFESPDGKILYYINYESGEASGRGLWSRPTGGEPDSQLERPVPELSEVSESFWAVADRGIVFVEFEPLAPGRTNPVETYNVHFASSAARIKFFDFASRRVTNMGKIDAKLVRTGPGFSVTRDGQSILWSQIDRDESDLMLIENFR